VFNLSSYRKADDGAVAVEGAILFPLLALIGFGIVDLSMMMLQTHKMEQGLVASASYLARAESPAQLTTEAKNIAMTGRPDGSGPERVAGWSANDITLTIRSVPNSGQYRGGSTIKVAELSSEYNYSGFGFIRLVTGGTSKIRSDHEERLVGAQ
jgi:hypothetical protein